jgi:hypothetical protein
VYKNLKSQLTGNEVQDELANFENLGNKEKIHLNEGSNFNKNGNKKCCSTS